MSEEDSTDELDKELQEEAEELVEEMKESEEEEDNLSDPYELYDEISEIAHGNHFVNGDGEECVAYSLTVGDTMIDIDVRVTDDGVTIEHLNHGRL